MDRFEAIQVLHVFGDLNTRNAQAFDSDVLSLVDSGKGLQLDFSECRSIDSSIVMVLFRARSAFGKSLAIVVDPRSTIDAKLTSLRLHEHLRIVPPSRV